MKKLMMTLLILGSVTVAFGQTDKRKPSHEDLSQRIQKAKYHLGLSEAQVIRWEEIHKKYRKELAALHSRPANTEKGGLIRDKIDRELLEVLSSDQKKKFLEHLKRDKRGQKPKH